MAMHETAALPTIALQLVGALDAYARELRDLVDRVDEQVLYEAVSRRMDEMRLYTSVLPAVSTPWVEVLIGHFELTHCVWRVRSGEATVEELRALHARHVDVIANLHARCVQIGVVGLV